MTKANSSRPVKGKRSGPGRPAHEPTPDQRALVLAMKAAGIDDTAVARVMQLDEKTLRKHYRHEMENGRQEANGRVAAFLFGQASGSFGSTSQAVTAAIFWAKTRMGFKEAVILENPDGSALFPDTRLAKLAGAAADVLKGGA